MTARRHPESMRRSHAAPPMLALAATAALAGPRPARLLGRAGIAAWLAATTVVAVKARGGGARAADAARLPVVFGVMHFTYGFAFLAGCLRMGIPFTALRGLVRRRAGT